VTLFEFAFLELFSNLGSMLCLLFLNITYFQRQKMVLFLKTKVMIISSARMAVILVKVVIFFSKIFCENYFAPRPVNAKLRPTYLHNPTDCVVRQKIGLFLSLLSYDKFITHGTNSLSTLCRIRQKFRTV
jgi:hypothetical protein